MIKKRTREKYNKAKAIIAVKLKSEESGKKIIAVKKVEIEN